MVEAALRQYLDALRHGMSGRLLPGILEVLRHGVWLTDPNRPTAVLHCSGMLSASATSVPERRPAQDVLCASPASARPFTPSHRPTQQLSVQQSQRHVTQPGTAP